MPRKITPRTDTLSVTGLAGIDQLSRRFWNNLERSGVPESVREEVGRALLDYILTEQYARHGETKRAERNAALIEGLKRIEAARDWLRDHDANYLDTAMSYLYMSTPNPPEITDYVASLDALARAIREAQTHDTKRTQHGPTA